MHMRMHDMYASWHLGARVADLSACVRGRASCPLCATPHAAELLTTDKLSELACLTLYLMYEKKVRPVTVARAALRPCAACHAPRAVIIHSVLGEGMGSGRGGAGA